MGNYGLYEPGTGKVLDAVARLVAVERRFGLLRDVEGGLFRARVFAADGAMPTVDAAFADWVQQRLGCPPLVPLFSKHRSLTTEPAVFADVHRRLLPEERFGVRSEGDSAWFDPSDETSPGVAERDDALRTLLTLLNPCGVCHLVDDRKPALDGVPIGVFVLLGAGFVVLCATVGLAVQLDTRSQEALFRDVDPPR